MRVTNSGDLATSLLLARNQADTKARIATLSREVSTGRHSDVAAVLKGETRGLSDLTHRLTLLDSYNRNTAEAASRLTAVQGALAAMDSVASVQGPALLAAAEQGSLALAASLAEAEDNLARSLGALNANWAGEYVFSGAAPSRPAVITPTALMDAITPQIAGLGDAADIIAAVDAFFDAAPGGGGFVDLGLTGATDPRGPVAIGAGESVRMDLTADAEAFRDLLKGAVLAVVAQRGGGTLAPAAQSRLAAAAGERMLDANQGLTALRAGQGVLERQVELAKARNSSERASLELARSDVVSADPYRAAAALVEAQVNLETIYEITARLSRLSLVNHL